DRVSQREGVPARRRPRCGARAGPPVHASLRGARTRTAPIAGFGGKSRRPGPTMEGWGHVGAKDCPPAAGVGVHRSRSRGAAPPARPAWDGLKEMPEPIAANVPSDAETFAKVNAAVQVGAGLLLATGRLPRIASTVLAGTVVPGRMGAHMFWTETDPQRKAE